MGSLKLTTASSGSVILSPANTASDVTITVPAVTGTMATIGPAFSAYLSTNQSVTTSTQTKIAFNTKVFDTANAYDNTTNYRFTPQVAGYYQISASMGSSATTSQTRAFVGVYKNGSQYARLQDSNGSSIYLQSGSVLVYLNGSTDYIEIYGQINGTSPAFDGGSASTWFTGTLVRAA